MNKKNIITALFALVALAGQGQNAKFKIEGSLGQSDFTGAVHIIDLLTNDTVSTAQVDKGMMLPTEGVLREIQMCRIVADDGSFQKYTLFLDEGTTRMDGCDEDGELRLSGTPACDDLNDFHLALRQNVEELSGGRCSEEETDSMHDKLISDFILRHKDDVLGLKVLTGMAVVSLPPAKWLGLLGSMNPKFTENPRLAKYLTETKAKMEVCVRTWVGKPFVDFTVDYNGKKTRLSDYVGHGQYVLADFWASWCGPCKRQIPDLIAMYQQYKGKGFTVLGIAVRDKPEKTEHAIAALGIPYPQIINAQDISATLYGVDAIPHTILFAPDGTIIARNIYGNQLKEKLAEIFLDK